jgi:leucyl/phenylalanyl-tRNA--protein transferase
LAEPFPRLEWDQEFEFPDPEGADEEGLVGAGGNLSPGMLLSGYRQGLFPWFTRRGEPFWFSPNPRFVLAPSQLHVSESLRKVLNKGSYSVTFDSAFGEVMHGCSETPRKGQGGTWITRDYFGAYGELHRLGFAHSVEVWQGPDLVGGLYGLHLGRVFCGESMFSRAPNASKVGFATLVPWLAAIHGVELIDCQQKTDYLGSFGAHEIPRAEFLSRLQSLVDVPGPRGKWTSPR